MILHIVSVSAHPFCLDVAKIIHIKSELDLFLFYHRLSIHTDKQRLTVLEQKSIKLLYLLAERMINKNIC